MANVKFKSGMTRRTGAKLADAVPIWNSDTDQSEWYALLSDLPFIASADIAAWAKAPTKPTYTYSEVGACSSSDPRLSDSRNAADVYSWAKAATKPSYTYSEVGAEPANSNIQAHISNNNQAHSDYLKNNADDASSGSITATDFILS